MSWMLCKVLYLRIRPISARKILANFMRMSSKHVVGVCQMTSRNNKEENFAVVKKLTQKAVEMRAEMVFFPEGCDYIGESKKETVLMAEPLTGPLMSRYQQLAKENSIWLSLGGIHEKVSEEKVSNCHVVIDNEGKIVGIYRKVHLFDVEIPDRNIRLKESDYVDEGTEVVEPISTPVGNVGLEICYDMRFPELSLCLRNQGADILTFPSAFTYHTGAHHWEKLLTARAIETQCYVIAAAQTGSCNPKRLCWGHAMIVNPWGEIIAQCQDGHTVSIAEIDLSYVKKVREEMPVIQHRRNDLYPVIQSFVSNKTQLTDDSVEVYQFGQVTVPKEIVFYKTRYSIAFTNKRCVVLGHVLVIPIRCALRFEDLKPEEITDLFLTVQKVEQKMEEIHKVSSTTVVIQDGKDAGQTIQHLHVHILPRRPGDFEENNDIYRELAKHDKNVTLLEWRQEKEMIEEAEAIRKYF